MTGWLLLLFPAGHTGDRRKGCRQRVVEGRKALLSFDVLNLKGQREALLKCLKLQEAGLAW